MVGNKWFYSARSNFSSFPLYAVWRQVIDTASDGTRNVLVTEFSHDTVNAKDSVAYEMEGWLYKDGQLKVSSSTGIISIVGSASLPCGNLFDSNLTRDTTIICIFPPGYSEYKWLSDEVFGDTMTVQWRYGYSNPPHADYRGTSIFQEGIGLCYDSIYASTLNGINFTTAIVLRGARLNGVVIGDTIVTSVGQLASQVPLQFSLYQNFPNPFNPSTTIKFELPKSSHVSLAVYDILGRELSLLVNERRNAGGYEVKFDGSNLASGVYFYRLEAGDFVQTKKLLILR